MNSNYHPDFLLEIGKMRMQEFYRKREALHLAQEARNFEPGRFVTAVTQFVNLFKRVVLKLEMRFRTGRLLREEADSNHAHTRIERIVEIRPKLTNCTIQLDQTPSGHGKQSGD